MLHLANQQTMTNVLNRNAVIQNQNEEGTMHLSPSIVCPFEMGHALIEN